MSLFEAAGVSFSCCILFYTFEVQSHVKMISCTHLVQELHKDHTATVRSPHGLCMEVIRAPCDMCDFYVRLRRQHNDRLISLLSPHRLSTTLHRSIVEIRQRNRTKADECKHIGRSPKLCLRCLKTVRKIIDK